MKDISKKLTVVNTDNRKPVTGPSANENVGGGGTGISFGGISIGGGLDYLLKAIWDKVWEIKTDSQGNEYIFGKLPVVTQYGITMYADGGELNLPSIYAGIPFDNKTIWLNPDTGKVEVIGGTGGGVADSVHWKNIEGKPSFSAVATSGKYADLGGLPDLSVYATTEYLTTELKKYVTLNTEQTIDAHKDFLNGLSIGGLPITKSQDDVIYLDANLVVRGGITMYATDAIDVPSIIDALPIASASAKGIAAFNPNDFSVVDGYVSFIGSAGSVDESVLADYAKKTDLSKYLPLSGGQMTGGIGYTLEPDSYDVGLPAAGSVYYANSWISSLDNMRTFIGDAYNTANSQWHYLLSIRHANGTSINSHLYGMYVYTSLFYNDSLIWQKKTESGWKGERVILDSENWRNYVTLGGNPTYDGVLTVNGSDVRGSYPALRMHIPNVNWQQFMMRGDGIVELRYGDAGQNNRWGQLALGTIFLDDQRDDVLYFPSKEYFDNHGNIHIPNADGSWSWNIFNSNGSNVMTIYTDGGLVAKKVSADYIMLKGEGSETYRLGFIGTSDAYGLYIEAGTTGTQHQGTLKPLFFGWRGGTAGMTLDGSKNLLVYGGITMYSDIRKKTKLQDVELSLKQIADAPLIEHYYNSDAMRTTHVGSIAQYWAGLNDWFCKLDSDGYYTMEIQNAALASAISIARELVKYESKTDRKIRLLKERVKELEDKIEKL